MILLIDRCGDNGRNLVSYLVPIGGKVMEKLLANRSVSITELKQPQRYHRAGRR